MATILEFPASLLRASSNAHTMSGIPGEVVLFPGVRYERVTEAPSASKPKKRPNSHRDLLELED